MTHETPDNTPPLAMAERPDWSLFRTFEGLQQQAGVPVRRRRQLVLKEIGDNALDTNTAIDYGEIDGGDRYFVEDSGPGLDGTPEQIAELFSMARPMRSTKLLRLPQRGALGNGLRVVAGTVFASEGSLVVITRNRAAALCLTPAPLRRNGRACNGRACCALSALACSAVPSRASGRLPHLTPYDNIAEIDAEVRGGAYGNWERLTYDTRAD